MINFNVSGSTMNEVFGVSNTRAEELHIGFSAILDAQKAHVEDKVKEWYDNELSEEIEINLSQMVIDHIGLGVTEEERLYAAFSARKSFIMLNEFAEIVSKEGSFKHAIRDFLK